MDDIDHVQNLEEWALERVICGGIDREKAEHFIAEVAGGHSDELYRGVCDLLITLVRRHLGNRCAESLDILVRNEEPLYPSDMEIEFDE
jgi:hypothetical protein